VTAPTDSPRHGIILPACNEEACIAAVLAELRQVLEPDRFDIAVGVNGSDDRTAELAREMGAVVAETPRRGYGYGCQVAIEALAAQRAAVRSFVFFAADGANDPRDIASLIAAHEEGAQMVIGGRTRNSANWSAMDAHYVLANRGFGFLCGCLTGRFFSDLGPLRLIERELFHALDLREWTYGWTIEAQIRAAMLGAHIAEVPVRERGRIAGQQKVSRVSWQRTLSVGLQITAAAFRTRFAGRAAGRR